MKGTISVARILDLIIDLTLKVLGIRFIILGDFIGGAICLGASGMYSLSMAAAMFLTSFLLKVESHHIKEEKE